MRKVGSTTVFGSPDEPTLAQIADVATRAEQTVLCADAHVGYVMPIGGVAAYRNQVSVVGVGFDIACLAVGSPVTTADGYHRPIESVTAADDVTCWDGAVTRTVRPHVGAVMQGRRDTVHLRLRNGRTVRCTPDHRILTRRGWQRADALEPSDRIACTPFVGLPHEPLRGELAPAIARLAVVDELRTRGLYPLSLIDPRFPALVRLLAYVSGDGRLTADGERISVYTTSEMDARAIQADFERLGAAPHRYRRYRAPHHRVEHHIAVDSIALHALFTALGAPVGRKRWASDPIPWLSTLPAWVRAHFLSAFCSAEMTTPRIQANGVVANLQLKQAGDDRAVIDFIADLFDSLGYDVSIAPSGPARDTRQVYVLQLLGGVAAQLRFFQEIGFCYAHAKRVAAARVASAAWDGLQERATRDLVKREARALHAAGSGWRRVPDDVSARHDVGTGFVYQAIYDDRGPSRRLPHAASIDTTDEICWVPVRDVQPSDPASVYDVVTGDPAQAFFADGIVVHNCGNAAIRTDLTFADLGRDPVEVHRRLEATADEIHGAISFGIGRRNDAGDAPVDHPLFDDPAWDAVPKRERQALLSKARAQLGTVGSGNHYVDVFADEGGTLWVGVHFGSRGFGHSVASAFLALGQGRAWGERVPEREVLLDVQAPIGHDYWHLMNLAGRYAYAGREWVARRVVSLLGGREVELVHNHHNFAWTETVGGEAMIVVRKGATPAFPGQKGFVGGSMGDDAVIVQGTSGASEEIARVQREALYSTVHGAGRVMSRTAAAGKRNRRTGQVLSPGLVTPEMMHGWLREKGVILRGGGLDESPQAYRRLPEVLAAQEGTIEILHTLRPLIVVMAGADEFDPYKD